jgi:hypothetical protein
MPSLKFIIGGTATPFAQAMKVAEAAATSAGTHTVQEFRKAAKEIESARANIMAMGGSTQFYDAALRKVNEEMSELERRTQAAKQASDALAQSRAKVAMGMGDEADFAAAKGIPRGITRAEFERSKLTGSEVIRKGPMEDQLRQLRAQMALGGAQEAAARAEIRRLTESRRRDNLRRGGGFNLGAGSRASAAMFVSAGRDTFTSLASGMPASQVALQQAPQVLQGLAMSGMKIPWAIAGAWAAAIAAIVGGFVLFRYRVKKLTEDLKDFADRAFDLQKIPKYLQKANEVRQAQLDIAAAIRTQADAYRSVEQQAARVAEITKMQFDFERKKLEVQKQNELANAKTDAQRTEIEQRFARAGVAISQQERAEQERQKRAEMVRLQREAEEKLAEAQKLTRDPDYMSDAMERERERLMREDADNARKYNAEQRAKDLETAGMSVSAGRIATFGPNGVASVPGGDDPALVAKREAAQRRLEENQKAIQRYEAFINEADTRKRARDRSKELQEQAKAAEVNAKKLADELNPKNPTGLAARNRLATEQENALLDMERRAKRSSTGGYTMELTSNQRIGAFAGGPQLGLLDVANKQLSELRQIKNALSEKKPVFIGGMRAN